MELPENIIKNLPIQKSRYDYTLAEFPFCLLQPNLKIIQTEDGESYYEYKDVIKGEGGKPIPRTWRIYGDPEAGFGGRTTLGTIYEIFQVWREQGFESRDIKYGTINRLIERKKGVKGTRNTYKATVRDLLFMAGAQYDAINAFYDVNKGAYVTIRRFKFFDFLAHYEKTPKQSQQPLPFNFIRASEILHKAVLSGTLSLDFDKKKFHKLTPLEQRLALWGSKIARSQTFIKRDFKTFTKQMTITAKDKHKIRQQFRKAVEGMNKKGVNIFNKVEFKKSSDRSRDNIIFHTSDNLPLPFQTKNLKSGSSSKPDYEIEGMVAEIMDVCGDEKSRQFYRKVAHRINRQDIFTALSEVKEEHHRGAANNKGAVFTIKIKRKAKEQGIDL